MAAVDPARWVSGLADLTQVAAGIASALAAALMLVGAEPHVVHDSMEIANAFGGGLRADKTL